jgi:hypothetical protein
MIKRFLACLAEATVRIPCHYFQFPVAGAEDPIYRERVYSYELYHQLRSLLEADDEFEEYALNGEVNKMGHSIIRPCAPDFVLHIPGLMTNLAVLEVKPINADAEGIQKDKQTLEYFVSNEVGYQCGIELVYGGAERDLTRFIRAFAGLPNKTYLYWHSRPGVPAVPVRIQ